MFSCIYESFDIWKRFAVCLEERRLKLCISAILITGFLGSVIDAGHDVMGSSIMLIEEVKIIVTNPRSADSQRKLQNVAKVRLHTRDAGVDLSRVGMILV